MSLYSFNRHRSRACSSGVSTDLLKSTGTVSKLFGVGWLVAGVRTGDRSGFPSASENMPSVAPLRNVTGQLVGFIRRKGTVWSSAIFTKAAAPCN